MGDRVSVEEAAQRLNVTAATIRRRLKGGKLNGWREPTPQGYIWRVELGELAPDTGDSPAPVQSPAADSTAGDVARLEAHCADLRATVETLTTELEARRQEVRALLTIVGAHRLPAPDAAGEPTPDVESQPAAPAPPSPTQSTPDSVTVQVWWRRLLTRLANA